MTVFRDLAYRKKKNLLISCLGASCTCKNDVSQIKIASLFSSNTFFAILIYVVDKIVDQLLHVSLDASWYEHFNSLILANPSFYLSCLLGVNITLAMLKGELLKTNNKKKNFCSPFWIRMDNREKCFYCQEINNISY